MATSADVLIRDTLSDSGAEPSSGAWWGSPDIVVRANDDDVFANQPAVRGQKNFIYVRVRNNGPETATDVNVSVRAVAYAATEFVYSSNAMLNDWALVNATHIKPFGLKSQWAKIDPGFANAKIFKFRLEKDEVDTLHNWELNNWHPCLLAEVSSDQDTTFAGFVTRVWQRNNLAQRNISTIKLSPKMLYPNFAFLAGNPYNREPYMEIVVDRSQLPRTVELLLDPSDETRAFPALGDAAVRRPTQTATKVLDRTRLAVSLCGADGILTLEPGSSFAWGNGGCADAIPFAGAAWVERHGRRLLAIRADEAVIGVPKAPGELRQMSLTFANSEPARAGAPLVVRVMQRNTEGRVVGGVTVVAEAE